jgi:REP-associated tyrosine transposase
MPRFPRAVLPDVPHHVTQRGVNRQPVFFSDADRRLYLDLVRESAEQSDVRLLGHCLMSNHAHWIATPA